MPTADQVADRAKAYSERGTNWGVGYCLKFSRTCAGALGGVYNAATAWKEADYRHNTGTPPRGALVYWTGGSAGHGHIAVSDGGGYVWSTDIKRPGRVDRVSIAYLTARWSNLRYEGWAEDVNGARVTGLQPEQVITVQLANLRPGGRSDDVADLQRALRRHGYGKLNPSGVTGYFGDETRAMVAAFQRDEPGLRGDADGIPGRKTAVLLGLHVL